MEIILKQDVANLGYKDEIVKVKNGYANNYLLPKGMAIIATPVNKKIHAENLKQRAHKEEALRKNAEAQQAALNGKTVKIIAKVGENGQLFGGINNIMVAEALKEQHNYDIDRKQIAVEVIKAVGNYTARVDVYKDIKAELNIEVVAE
ncbi:MAG: 50S ribosomal protein L9 [Bacteroidales bacterium]|nr:50S ribosomal protein L9 [Bacteroidales bacterium]